MSKYQLYLICKEKNSPNHLMVRILKSQRFFVVKLLQFFLLFRKFDGSSKCIRCLKWSLWWLWHNKMRIREKKEWKIFSFVYYDASSLKSSACMLHWKLATITLLVMIFDAFGCASFSSSNTKRTTRNSLMFGIFYAL